MSKHDDWLKSPDVKDQTVSYFIKGVQTLWVLIKAEKRRVIIAVVLMALGEILNLSFPLFFRELVDYLPNVLKSGMDKFVWIIIILIFAINAVKLILRRFFQEPIFIRALINLENLWPIDAHEKLLALSINYHETENTGKKSLR